jgi:hypothetical protein
MKKINLVQVFIIILAGLIVCQGRIIKPVPEIHNQNFDTLEIKMPEKPTPIKPTGGVRAFLSAIGKVEGLGSYKIISKSGYLGMYQFHPKTLKSVGINVSADEYLQNPALQDSAMILYMKENKRELKSIIKKFNGTYFNGIYITQSGILAGAHLVGSAGIFAYFYPEKFKFRTVDGNGISVEKYIEKFAGYDLRGL